MFIRKKKLKEIERKLESLRISYYENRINKNKERLRDLEKFDVIFDQIYSLECDIYELKKILNDKKNS